MKSNRGFFVFFANEIGSCPKHKIRFRTKKDDILQPVETANLNFSESSPRQPQSSDIKDFRLKFAAFITFPFLDFCLAPFDQKLSRIVMDTAITQQHSAIKIYLTSINFQISLDSVATWRWRRIPPRKHSVTLPPSQVSQISATFLAYVFSVFLSLCNIIFLYSLQVPVVLNQPSNIGKVLDL